MPLIAKHLEELVSERRQDYVAELHSGDPGMTRSLFQVLSDTKLVAKISAFNEDRVRGRYVANGGESEITSVERLCTGVLQDTCEIYA